MVGARFHHGLPQHVVERELERLLGHYADQLGRQATVDGQGTLEGGVQGEADHSTIGA